MFSFPKMQILKVNKNDQKHDQHNQQRDSNKYCSHNSPLLSGNRRVCDARAKDMKLEGHTCR